MSPNVTKVLLSVVLLSIFPSGAPAAESKTDSRDRSTDVARGEVLALLRQTEEAFARSNSPEDLARSLYAPNITILGPADATVTHGMTPATSDMRSFLTRLASNGRKTCSYKLHEPMVASSDVFSSFVTLQCAANPPTLPQGVQARMLLVWKKLPEGWRIVLQMWNPGKL